MNNTTSNDLTNAYQVYEQLLTGQQSLILGTINEDGTPLTSYTPYIVDEPKQFYIFISQLAAHTANLQRNGQASLLLIEDESTAAQIFARKRLTFQCLVNSIARDTAEWSEMVDQFEARFGGIIKMLRSLSDFQLFRLMPTSGTLVVGFGQAYELSGERLDTLTHRRSA